MSSVVYGYGLVLSSPFFMSIGELMILTANTGRCVILAYTRGYATYHDRKEYCIVSDGLEKIDFLNGRFTLSFHMRS